MYPYGYADIAIIGRQNSLLINVFPIKCDLVHKANNRQILANAFIFPPEKNNLEIERKMVLGLFDGIRSIRCMVICAIRRPKVMRFLAATFEECAEFQFFRDCWHILDCKALHTCMVCIIIDSYLKLPTSVTLGALNVMMYTGNSPCHYSWGHTSFMVLITNWEHQIDWSNSDWVVCEWTCTIMLLCSMYMWCIHV